MRRRRGDTRVGVPRFGANAKRSFRTRKRAVGAYRGSFVRRGRTSFSRTLDSSRSVSKVRAESVRIGPCFASQRSARARRRGKKASEEVCLSIERRSDVFALSEKQAACGGASVGRRGVRGDRGEGRPEGRHTLLNSASACCSTSKSPKFRGGKACGMRVVARRKTKSRGQTRVAGEGRACGRVRAKAAY